MSTVRSPEHLVEPATRAARMRAPVLAVGGLGLATLALHFRDPHRDGAWGYCPTALLGFVCPGCGALRAVNDLTDLRFLDALSSNLALVLAAPFVVVLLARWARQRWIGVDRPLDRTLVTRAAWVVLPLLAVFTVLRNLPLPVGEWLAP